MQFAKTQNLQEDDKKDPLLETLNQLPWKFPDYRIRYTIWLLHSIEKKVNSNLFNITVILNIKLSQTL